MNGLSGIRRVMHHIWLMAYSPAALGSTHKGGGQHREFNEYMAQKLSTLLGDLYKEKCEMNGRKNKGFVPNLKFVDLDLTSEQKAGFKEWNWDDEQSIAALDDLGVLGYKFGTRYDKTNGAWIVSCTCAENGMANFGCCLTARGRSFLHALSIVLYKHYIVLRENWTAALPDDENDGGWG